MKFGAMEGMKKSSIAQAQSSHGAATEGEKHTVELPPSPPSIVLPPVVPGRGNSDRMSTSVGTKVIVIGKRGEGDVLAEAMGSCSKVGQKRKIPRLQRAKKILKRMKAKVEKKRAETNHMRELMMEETTKFQAAAEKIEAALRQGREQNELTMAQNLQDQLLLMLGWSYIVDDF